jgi:hypothetical protein
VAATATRMRGQSEHRSNRDFRSGTEAARKGQTPQADSRVRNRMGSTGSSAPQGRVEKRADLAREAEGETPRDFHTGSQSGMPAISAVTG